MARLIDADALRVHRGINVGANLGGIRAIVLEKDIRNAPTVDAVPVVHGRWITRNKGQNNWVECSECNTVGSPFWKCCPVCTAMMDGGNEDG